MVNVQLPALLEKGGWGKKYFKKFFKFTNTSTRKN